ncbi:MAG: transporter [Flavobacteriaceae bacterium]|nr:transporter [Flavobacteriaceae bacterium]
MNLRSTILHLLFVLIWAVASSQYTPIINSNRPGLTQGAFAVAPGVYQLEFGTSYRQDQFVSLAQAKSQGAGFTLDLRTGLILQNLELIYRVDYHSDQLAFNNASGRISNTRKGTKRNTVGFKLLLFDPFRNADWYKVNTKSYKANKGLRLIDLIPAISVYFGSELSFGNIYPYGEPFSPIFNLTTPELKQDEISGELMLITQNHFLNNFVLVTNWGRRYLGSAYEQNYMSSSLMIPIKKKLMSFVEQVSVKNQLSSDIFLTVGAVYLFNENLQVDAFLSHTLKDTPAMFSAGVGVSYRVDRFNDSGIPYEIKQLRRQRKKNRLDRKINAEKLKEFKDRDREKRKAKRKQKKAAKK